MPDFVSLHQDSAYWSLDRPDGLSAWLAFDDCDLESGCMQVVPDTHKEPLDHVERVEPTNMLWRGQTVDRPIDMSRLANFVLKGGEMSLHHARIVHGSGPNRSSRRRIGYSIRYLPTYVRREGPRDSAMLVRGVDAYSHFDLEAPPAYDYDPAAVRLHKSPERNVHYRRYGEKTVGNAAEPTRTIKHRSCCTLSRLHHRTPSRATRRRPIHPLPTHFNVYIRDFHRLCG